MTELIIKQLLSAWDSQNNNMNKVLDRLSDEQLAKPTAPGRNTGVYLLGHLAAASDGMLTLMDLGAKLYPELEEIFLRKPDNSGLEKPATPFLREAWKKISDTLSQQMAAMTPEQWLAKHTAVSEEDFVKEPHRNKLNILVSRTSHLAYHLGQLAYL